MRSYEVLRPGSRTLLGGLGRSDSAVVARRYKLLAAGVVLAIGAALAWPLRRSDPIPSARFDVAPSATAPSYAAPAPDTAPTIQTPAGTFDAQLAAMRRHDEDDPFADIPPAAVAPASDTGPLFSTVSSGSDDAAPPAVPAVARQVHVVHEGDSLDRLAKRYLGDEGRALEIFDLNRDVLDNPHVLRIGAELQIPPATTTAN
jgi:nucleoid-associated protein YgaU